MILDLDGVSMYLTTLESDEGFALVFINAHLEANGDATLFGDGTFKTAPLDAAQVFNIFRNVEGYVSINEQTIWHNNSTYVCSFF